MCEEDLALRFRIVGDRWAGQTLHQLEHGVRVAGLGRSDPDRGLTPRSGRGSDP